jgi:hypothetical protein
MRIKLMYVYTYAHIQIDSAYSNVWHIVNTLLNTIDFHFVVYELIALAGHLDIEINRYLGL